MTCDDPRRRGFSYGTGWGKAQKPTVYHQAEQLARRLGGEAIKASQAAWRVEMATRSLRLAETETERKEAISLLTDLVLEYDLTAAQE